jgi:polar amino acid transport system substrate-binding protein
MSRIKLLFTIVTIIAFISLAFNIYQWNVNLSLVKQSNQEEMEQLLIQAEAAINAELLRLDRLLSNACQQLSTTGLTGSEAEKILDSLCTQNSNLITYSATADKNDLLLVVQPSKYSSITDQDIKHQEQNIEMHKTMRPTLSNFVYLGDGISGVMMVSPVFDSNEQLIGSLTIAFQPYQLIYPIVKDSTKGVYTIYALQQNGTLIYDVTTEEQGKNIFTDESYAGHTELLTFIHQVVDTRSGYGTYSYFDDLVASRPLASKEAYWTTIGIHNTDWRLVIAHNL